MSGLSQAGKAIGEHMSYLIVHTTNEKQVRKLFIELQKRHPKLLVLKLNRTTWVMRNNGLTLIYLANLFNRYPNEIYVWVADRILSQQFPEECIKAGNWLNEKPGRTLNNARKYFGITKEVLEKCKINYSLNLKK